MATPRVTLTPMTEAEYPAYLDLAVPVYAEANVAAGYWAREDALDQSRAAYERLLPEGLATPDQFLFVARDADSGETVGHLWVALRPQADGPQAFVYDIAIEEGLRGRGYGRATMTACAAKARELGAVSVGLHVFRSNETAYGLYESLGFRPTSVNMRLPL